MTDTPAIYCPICAEPAAPARLGFAGYRAPVRYDIHACDRCDLQFAWPFASNAEIYEAIYRQPHLLSGYSRYQEFARAVTACEDPLAYLSDAESMYWFVAGAVSARDADRTKTILEVGCGLGYLTYALKRAGHNAKGVDISEHAVASARSAFGDNYICADVNALAAETAGSFDIVVMTEVLEHLDAPLAVLRSLRALLRPGGVALVSTPSKDFLPDGAVWRTDNPPVHLAWYSKTSLREMARRTDFRIQFADFTDFNRGRIAGIGAPRDLRDGAGAFRLSEADVALDRLPPPRRTPLIDAVPGLRRLSRRRKYVRRALELYATQSEVLGAILQRPDAG